MWPQNIRSSIRTIFSMTNTLDRLETIERQRNSTLEKQILPHESTPPTCFSTALSARSSRYKSSPGAVVGLVTRYSGHLVVDRRGNGLERSRDSDTRFESTGAARRGAQV